MSEKNNHINYTAADIERYWKGQLSAAEQHKLEKAALDDPFLADAIEGYEEKALVAAPAIAADNNELKRRLAERIAEKNNSAPVIKFGWWKVAAVIMVFIGAGWLYTSLNSKKAKDQGLVKQEIKKEVPLPPNADTMATPADVAAKADTFHDVAINKKIAAPSVENALRKEKNKSAEAETDAAPPASSAEPVAVNRETKTTKWADSINDKKEEVAKLSEAKKSVVKSFSTDQVPQKTTTAEGFSTNNNALARRANALSNTFNGSIIDQQNKPVANASIQIPNLNVATHTDKQGYFSFNAADTALSVSIASNGFETQNIHLNNKDATLNQIVLTPAPANLREVVVQSYGAQKRKQPISKDISIKIMDAEPIAGWNEYNAYLEKNKKVNDDLKDIHGTVIVSFQVHQKVLNNFEIEQSLDDELDEEAIRLIKKGPAWKLLKGKKATVSVVVKF